MEVDAGRRITGLRGVASVLSRGDLVALSIQAFCLPPRKTLAVELDEVRLSEAVAALLAGFSVTVVSSWGEGILTNVHHG